MLRIGRIRPGLYVLVLGIATGGPCLAASDPPAADPHAHHHQMLADRHIVRSTMDYQVPSVQLVRDDGRTVDLRHELDDGRIVVLNFIYTTCTTICPVSSQVFSQLQERLGPDRDKVHLVSISIDPEQDTPQRLRSYAAQFHARAGWQHYTGTVQQSREAQLAFGAYRGDKMSHSPLTLVRAANGGPWVRYDGFATADELLAEIRGTESVAAAR
jgi:protein SCO1/2